MNIGVGFIEYSESFFSKQNIFLKQMIIMGSTWDTPTH